MTTPALTFRVKAEENGELLIEVSPATFKEPTIVEMPYTCMPGSRRRGEDRQPKKIFAF
jgi:hypothetical protein